MGVEDEVTCASTCHFCAAPHFFLNFLLVVCLDLLNDPRLLSCSHSFCLACLKSLPLPLSCPSCRKTTPADKGIEALAKNHPLANIADALRKKHKAHKPTEVCVERANKLTLGRNLALARSRRCRLSKARYASSYCQISRRWTTCECWRPLSWTFSDFSRSAIFRQCNATQSCAAQVSQQVRRHANVALGQQSKRFGVVWHSGL